MRWFHVHASRIAVAAIISLAALGASSLSPHEDDCHDSACGAVFVEHDASAHRITAPSPVNAHAPHCLVCHWARSFRLRTDPRILPTPAADAGIVVHVEFVPAVAAALTAQPSLRAPPSSPSRTLTAACGANPVGFARRA
jgi:hypothetical protein